MQLLCSPDGIVQGLLHTGLFKYKQAPTRTCDTTLLHRTLFVWREGQQQEAVSFLIYRFPPLFSLPCQSSLRFLCSYLHGWQFLSTAVIVLPVCLPCPCDSLTFPLFLSCSDLHSFPLNGKCLQCSNCITDLPSCYKNLLFEKSKNLIKENEEQGCVLTFQVLWAFLEARSDNKHLQVCGRLTIFSLWADPPATQI